MLPPAACKNSLLPTLTPTLNIVRVFIFANLIIGSHLRDGWKWACINVLFLLSGRHRCNGRILLCLSSWLLCVITESLGKCNNEREKGSTTGCPSGITGASGTEWNPSAVAPSGFSRKPLQSVYHFPQALYSTGCLWYSATTSPSAQRTWAHTSPSQENTTISYSSSINLPISASIPSASIQSQSKWKASSCPRLILPPQHWALSPPNLWGLLLHKWSSPLPLSLASSQRLIHPFST